MCTQILLPLRSMWKCTPEFICNSSQNIGETRGLLILHEKKISTPLRIMEQEFLG